MSRKFIREEFDKCTRQYPFIKDDFSLIGVFKRNERWEDHYALYFLKKNELGEEWIVNYQLMPSIWNFYIEKEDMDNIGFLNFESWIKFTSELGFDAIIQLSSKYHYNLCEFLLKSIITCDISFTELYLEELESSFNYQDPHIMRRLEILLKIGLKNVDIFRKYIDGIEKLLLKIPIIQLYNYPYMSVLLEFFKSVVDGNYFLVRGKEYLQDIYHRYGGYPNLFKPLIIGEKVTLYDNDDIDIETLRIPNFLLRRYYVESPIRKIYLHKNYKDFIKAFENRYHIQEIWHNPSLFMYLPMLLLRDSNFILEYRNQLLEKYTDLKPFDIKSFIFDIKPLINVLLLDILKDGRIYLFNEFNPLLNLLYLKYVEETEVNASVITYHEERYNHINEFFLVMRNFDVLLEPLVSLIKNKIRMNSALKKILKPYYFCKDIIQRDPYRWKRESRRAKNLWK